MDLEDLANIGELVAAIGVLASLIYVSIQIKRNESTTRAATTQDLLAKSTDMMFSHANGSAYTKFLAGIDLSADEEAQMLLYTAGIFSHYNSAHHLYRVGKLDPEIWEMFDTRARLNIKRDEGFEAWWLNYKGFFTLSFQEYIDDIRSGTQK